MRRLAKAVAFLFFLSANSAMAEDNSIVVVDGISTNIGTFINTGTNNLLLVTNGGSARITSAAVQKTAQGNAVLVDGIGSALSGTLSLGGISNTVQFFHGGVILGGLTINGTNELVIYDQTTITNSAVISNGRTNTFLFRDSALRMNLLELRGANSTVELIRSTATNSGELDLETSRNNRVTLRQGSVYQGANVHLWGMGTRLEILDPETSFQLSGIVSISNELPIAPGVVVQVANGATMLLPSADLGISTHYNELDIDGPGSFVRIKGVFTLGGGIRNKMLISNGGSLTSGNTMISGVSNVIALSGAACVWSNASTLQFSFGSGSNRLEILDGSIVATRSFVSDAWSNQYMIDGASRLAIAADAAFTTGSTVSGRGTVSSGRLMLKGNSAQRLDIAGVRWVLSTNISLTTSSNILNLNGSFLEGPELNFGTFSPSSGMGSGTNNQVVLSGGSVLGVSSINVTSMFNTIRISDGSTLRSDNISIKRGRFSVEVSGPGSSWTHGGDLVTADFALYDSIRVAGGATMTNGNASIGVVLQNIFSSFQNFASAMVDGPGSFWKINGDLSIGYRGNSNSVTIANNAKMEATNVRVGFFAPEFDGRSNGLIGSQNQLIVDGPGSSVTAMDKVLLGWRSTNNRLHISRGATVTANGFQADHFELFDSPASPGSNVVEVLGEGSKFLLKGDYSADGGGYLAVSPGAYIEANNANLPGHSDIRGLVALSGHANFPAPALFIGDGGSLTATQLNLGAIYQGGSLTVTGAHSYLKADTISILTGSSHFQAQSAFTLRATDQATIETGHLTLGLGAPTSTNLVVVDNNARMNVTAPDGTGLVEMENGRIEIQSGLFRADELRATSSNTSLLASGVLSIGNADTPADGALMISKSALLQGPAQCRWLLVSGASRFPGQLTIKQGASLTVAETASFGANSSLDFIISGPSSIPAIASPTVNLIGNLSVTLDATNQLHAGDSVAFIAAGLTVNGTFANVANGSRLATMDGVGSFRINISATGVLLEDFQPASVPPPLTVRFDPTTSALTLSFEAATKVQTS